VDLHLIVSHDGLPFWCVGVLPSGLTEFDTRSLVSDACV